MVDGGGGSDRYDTAGERDWYRISFGESKDPDGWHKGTTSCVVTAEMGDGERYTIIITIEYVRAFNEAVFCLIHHSTSSFAGGREIVVVR